MALRLLKKVRLSFDHFFSSRSDSIDEFAAISVLKCSFNLQSASLDFDSSFFV